MADAATARQTLPNFLIIGAQKSGTSWLARKLQGHPEVFMAPHEIHFFNKDYNFRKGLSWYSAHFARAGDKKAIGEKTPDYIWANGKGVEGHQPQVHQHIAQTLPDARLIAVFRNPVTRAVSALNHLVRSGRVSPLHKADDLLLGSKRHLIEGHGVIEYGYYYRHLRAFLEYFPWSQILVLIHEEDIVQDPARGLERVCEFLGIDASYGFGEIEGRVNASHGSRLALAARYYLPAGKALAYIIDRCLPLKDYYMTPSDEAMAQLYDLYAEENDRLSELIGRRTEAWQSYEFSPHF